MDSPRRDECRACHSRKQNGTKSLTMAHLDAFEIQTLTVARQFFESFARPEGHAWMHAFHIAEQAFPAPFGATIAHAILIAVNEMRVRRKRTFQFERPGSPFAVRSMTDCERYLIAILHHIRRKEWTSARSNALYLCEGNETGGVLAAFERLAIITGDVTETRFNELGVDTPGMARPGEMDVR